MSYFQMTLVICFSVRSLQFSDDSETFTQIIHTVFIHSPPGLDLLIVRVPTYYSRLGSSIRVFGTSHWYLPDKTRRIDNRIHGGISNPHSQHASNRKTTPFFFKGRVRGLSALQPVGRLYPCPNEFPSYISRGATHYIGTRNLC